MLSDNSKAEVPMERASRPEASQRKGTGLSTILKAGITLLILGYIAYTVDLSAAWQRAATQDLTLVAVAGLILMLQVGFGGSRWLIILRSLGAKPPTGGTL